MARRERTDDLSDEMLDAYFQALANRSVAQADPPPETVPERLPSAEELRPDLYPAPPPPNNLLSDAPRPRNFAERVVEGTTGVDYSEPSAGLPPGARPPLSEAERQNVFNPPAPPPSISPPTGSVFGFHELTPETQADLWREHSRSLDEGVRNEVAGDLTGTALLAGGGPAAGLARSIGRRALASPRTSAAITAGSSALLAPAETQTPSELDRARAEETRRRTRITTLEKEDGDLRTRAEMFDGLREEDSDRIRRAQAALNIRQDGRLGTETRAAIAAERARIESERKRVGGQLETARADLQRQESERQRIEGDERARGTRAGPWQQAAREIGPWLSAALGAYTGHRTRTGAVRRANELTERNVAEANALLTPGPLMPGRSAAARADTMARAARMNEFWARGGAGEAVPFSPVQNARGFRSRPGAAEAATLFPPDTRRFRGQDWGHIGAGLGEAVLSGGGWYLAQQELAEAQAAVDRDRSEINLARLERAHDMVALAQAFLRAGLGYAGGRAGGAFIHPYSNARPNISGAEGERMLLNQLLTPASRRRR